MKNIDSTCIVLDGESKCGKTTFVNAIADEAEYQMNVYTNAGLTDTYAKKFEKFIFDAVHRVSAGNAFRAVAFYKIEIEKNGATKSGFDESDSKVVRQLLNEEGARDFLQTDRDVERSVSSVAQLTGALALSETIFCDEVIAAYHHNEGANLVIADARNPVELMTRNGIIGLEPTTILPGSIVPIFIDTPVELAAARTPGDFAENLANITGRRLKDTSRKEYPFVRPARSTHKLRPWLGQFPHPETESGIAIPLVIMNDESLPFVAIQGVASQIALAAHDTAAYLYYSRQPGYERPVLSEAVQRILAADPL